MEQNLADRVQAPSEPKFLTRRLRFPVKLNQVSDSLALGLLLCNALLLAFTARTA